MRLRSRSGDRRWFWRKLIRFEELFVALFAFWMRQKTCAVANFPFFHTGWTGEKLHGQTIMRRLHELFPDRSSAAYATQLVHFLIVRIPHPYA